MLRLFFIRQIEIVMFILHKNMKDKMLSFLEEVFAFI